MYHSILTLLVLLVLLTLLTLLTLLILLTLALLTTPPPPLFTHYSSKRSRSSYSTYSIQYWANNLVRPLSFVSSQSATCMCSTAPTDGSTSSRSPIYCTTCTNPSLYLYQRATNGCHPATQPPSHAAAQPSDQPFPDQRFLVSQHATCLLYIHPAWLRALANVSPVYIYIYDRSGIIIWVTPVTEQEHESRHL